MGNFSDWCPALLFPYAEQLAYCRKQVFSLVKSRDGILTERNEDLTFSFSLLFSILVFDVSFTIFVHLSSL